MGTKLLDDLTRLHRILREWPQDNPLPVHSAMQKDIEQDQRDMALAFLLWTARKVPEITAHDFTRMKPRPKHPTLPRHRLIPFCTAHAIPLPDAAHVTEEAFVDHVQRHMPRFRGAWTRFRFHHRKHVDEHGLWVLDPRPAAKALAALGYPGVVPSKALSRAEMNDAIKARHKKMVEDIKTVMREVNEAHPARSDKIELGALVEYDDPELRPEWDAPKKLETVRDMVDELDYLRRVRRLPMPPFKISADAARYIGSREVFEYCEYDGGDPRAGCT